MSDHWKEANGGLRASTMLKLGAAAYFLAALVSFSVRLSRPGAVGPDDPLFFGALLVWDATLFLLAGGFVWTGIHPFLSRYGLAVGLFFAIQAAYLMLSLISRQALIVPPVALTMGRNLLVGLIAFIEFQSIRRITALFLALGSFLQFGRVVLGGFAGLTMPDPALETSLSLVLMSLTACGIFLLGQDVRGHEETWALANLPRRQAEFEDFNNPRHFGPGSLDTDDSKKKSSESEA